MAQTAGRLTRLLTASSKVVPELKQFESVVSAPKSMGELSAMRSQIWKLRTEYWWRRIAHFNQTSAQAKVEFEAFLKRLGQPGEWTLGEIGGAGIFSLQVYGCFCLGEMWGRGNVFGYDVGTKDAHH